MRWIDVPEGYKLVDVNDCGDLLLGSAEAAEGQEEAARAPFTGRSIDNQGQILGTGLYI